MYIPFSIICRARNRLNVLDAYAIGCGVLATIEQWYPTRKFNGTREILRFGRVWSQKRRQSSTPQVPCVQCVCACMWLYSIRLFWVSRPGVRERRCKRVASVELATRWDTAEERAILRHEIRLQARWVSLDKSCNRIEDKRFTYTCCYSEPTAKTAR